MRKVSTTSEFRLRQSIPGLGEGTTVVDVYTTLRCTFTPSEQGNPLCMHLVHFAGQIRAVGAH